MLKKCSLILLTFFLIGCSSSSESKFNPPSWIQGAWTSSPLGFESGFKFTSSDIYIIFGQLIPTGLSADSSSKELSSTDSTYSFSYESTSNGVTQTNVIEITKGDGTSVSSSTSTDGGSPTTSTLTNSNNF